MRKWFLALLFILGFIFIITRFGEIEQVLAVIQAADWRFFTMALALQAVWFGLVTRAYQRFYQAMQVREKLSRLFLVVTAANFITILTPSGGMTGLAVFLSDARRRGHSIGHVMVACVLYLISDYTAIFLIGLSGFCYLHQLNRLNWVEITAASIIGLVLLGLCSLLYLGVRSTERFGCVLARLACIINRIARPILRKPLVSEAWAHHVAEETAEGITRLARQPGLFAAPVAITLGNKLVLMAILWVMFLAFKVPFTPWALVTGFGTTYLFAIVTPSPSTVGVLESLMTLSLVAVNVRLEAAAVITLGYRAVTFWLPFFLGGWTLRQLSLPVGGPPAEPLFIPTISDPAANPPEEPRSDQPGR